MNAAKICADLLTDSMRETPGMTDERLTVMRNVFQCTLERACVLRTTDACLSVPLSVMQAIKEQEPKFHGQDPLAWVVFTFDAGNARMFDLPFDAHCAAASVDPADQGPTLFLDYYLSVVQRRKANPTATERRLANAYAADPTIIAAATAMSLTFTAESNRVWQLFGRPRTPLTPSRSSPVMQGPTILVPFLLSMRLPCVELACLCARVDALRTPNAWWDAPPAALAVAVAEVVTGALTAAYTPDEMESMGFRIVNTKVWSFDDPAKPLLVFDVEGEGNAPVSVTRMRLPLPVYGDYAVAPDKR